MSTEQLVDSLSKCPLFVGMPPAQISLILTELDYKLVKFASHEYIRLPVCLANGQISCCRAALFVACHPFRANKSR